MITVKEYVYYKYESKTIAITEDEANAFGIPYPTCGNWFIDYSDMLVTETTLKSLYDIVYWKSKRMSGIFLDQPSESAKIAIKTLNVLWKLFGKCGIFDYVPNNPFAQNENKKPTAREKRKAKRVQKKKEKFSYEKVKPVIRQKVKKQSTRNGVSHVISKCCVDVKSDAFLNTFEWKALRMQALTLHGAKCQCCGATPATGAVMNVDHVKPRKFYPELALSLDNLQVLCGDCNHGKGNWNQTDWRTTK